MASMKGRRFEQISVDRRTGLPPPPPRRAWRQWRAGAERRQHLPLRGQQRAPAGRGPVDCRMPRPGAPRTRALRLRSPADWAGAVGTGACPAGGPAPQGGRSARPRAGGQTAWAAAGGGKEREARSLVQEDRRRGRAMTLRYPHQASHDAARAKAIEMVDSITAAIEQRIDELKKQRKELDAQMDLYKKNPDKIPTALRHELAAYEENMDEQRRFMADQLQEKQRVHQRFDTELALLRKIWEAQPQPQPQLPTLGTASPK